MPQQSGRPSLGLSIEAYVASLRTYIVGREVARAEDAVIHHEMAEALREDAERRRSRARQPGRTARPPTPTSS